jgi:hypothetical protein
MRHCCVGVELRTDGQGVQRLQTVMGSRFCAGNWCELAGIYNRNCKGDNSCTQYRAACELLGQRQKL